MDHRPDDPDTAPPAETRRSTWSRRIAIGLLVIFALFVLFNLVTVLVLAYRSVVEGQGGPFP
jgi:hypothetical protein